MSTLPFTPVTGPWRDRSLDPAARAAELLRVMTLREKIQQLGSTWPGEEDAGGDVAPMQETFAGAESFEEAILDGVGHVTRPFGTAPVVPEDGVRRLADLQRAVVRANRFGIPALAHEECLTGFTAWQATVYPTSLAWAATWRPDLVEEMASRIGADLARVGVHHGLSPVLDVVRDYRWGRVEETMGEDPYLVSEVGLSYVTGLQSAGVAATLKHFAGYAASRGARNHAPVSIGRRELADVVLPPFEKAVVVGGVSSVMNSYADLDGVPPASDPWLLTELLRGEWGFDGTVVSDYWAIPFLQSTHGVAQDARDAGVLALMAGIDVELPHTLGFGRLLESAVREGLVDEAFVDRAALRVLTQKAASGLLDTDWVPVEVDGPVDLDSVENRRVATAVAEASVVLLANDAARLPLRGASSIAVIGPGADDPACLFGCYSFPNHVVVKNPGTAIGVHAPTILDAIRREFPEAEVSYAAGCDIREEDPSGIAAAVEMAKAADVTILVVGDRSGMFGHGTSGEGCDVETLALPGAQHALAEAVLATGRDVVLVVVSGRPYAIGNLAARSVAAVQTFFPGQEGGGAVAGVLSGRVDPSGRLPVQIPGSSASQPGTYLGPRLAQPSHGVSNLDPTPAFAFGHGISYTTLELMGVEADNLTAATDGEFVLHVTVANTGDRAGTCVPQLYLTDPVASVARPVRQLVGFASVELAATETAVITFTIPADLASYTGSSGRRVVESGSLVLTVAQSAADAGHAVHVELVGHTRSLDHRRAMSSTAVVTRTTRDDSFPA